MYLHINTHTHTHTHTDMYIYAEIYIVCERGTKLTRVAVRCGISVCLACYVLTEGTYSTQTSCKHRCVEPGIDLRAVACAASTSEEQDLVPGAGTCRSTCQSLNNCTPWLQDSAINLSTCCCCCKYTNITHIRANGIDSNRIRA
jgi:hypothetical protein